MTEFAILDFGTFLVKENQMHSNLNKSWLQFYRKFKDLLIELPATQITFLKKVISNPNTWISYNPRYYKTFISFFKKLQIHSLKRDYIGKKSPSLNELKQFVPSSKVNFSYISAQKFQNYLLNTRQNIFNHQPTIKRENKVVEFKQITLQPIISLIESKNFPSALTEIQSIISAKETDKLPHEIQNGLKSCEKYLFFTIKHQAIVDMLNTAEFFQAQIELNELKKTLKLKTLTDPFRNSILKLIQESQKCIDRGLEEALHYVEDLLHQANSYFEEQDYMNAVEILEEISQLAQIYHFKKISQLIVHLHTQIINEFSIFDSLRYFIEEKYPRVHLSEVTKKAGISPPIAENVIKKLIKSNAIKASYNSNSQGITFNFLQSDIDALLNQFENWNSEKINKKLA